MELHQYDKETQELADQIARFVRKRFSMEPPPLGGPVAPEILLPQFEGLISKEGMGPTAAFDFFENVINPATISTDHPLYLAYVPNAPANAASLIDVVVSACSTFAGTWQEGAGVVAAENQALRFIMDVVGYPESAEGVFVSGGTAANLSALIAARHWFRRVHPEMEKVRLAIACAPSAHSSIKHAAQAMDVDILHIPGDDYLRLTPENLEQALDSYSVDDNSRLFAIIATAGATNSGYVDELKRTGEIAFERDVWFHVDGAYGGAAMLCEETAPLFDGIVQADSFVVDPHKWLFSPFDCAALIYKDPLDARLAHAQHAEYLDAINYTEFNPSDYAHHLTRRARGLPLWFTLAVHGTDAFAQAISQCVHVAHRSAEIIRKSEHVELVIEPQLSIILFRRKGWKPEQYEKWCAFMLEKEFAFIVPTSYKGETVLRMCIVNPATTVDDISFVLDSLS